MRAAIYFTPAQDDPLTQRAAHWLGRDAFTGMASRAADPEIDVIVGDPARYGFHATLKAPFRLADGRSLEELDAAIVDFARGQHGILLGTLALKRIDGFLALIAEKSDELANLEANVREIFEPFRAPLTEAEIARRQPDRLTERQRSYLDQWGYPHVGPDFRFHMTLSNSLKEPELDQVEECIRQEFGDVLDQPAVIDALALFVEPEPATPFIVHSRHSLRVPAFS